MLDALSDIDAANVSRCARVLLRRPLLRADGADGDLLPLIHRYRTALQEVFSALLGYQLLVHRRYARLYKTGLGPDSTRGEAGLNPRGYAYFALAIAALTGTGQQVLLSRLVRDIRAAALEAGIGVRDDLADRRMLAAALRQLVLLGVIRETEGTVAAMGGDSPGEALITIDTDLLGLLLTESLAELTGPEQVIANAESAGARSIEQVVRRKLVEKPVVLYDDLTHEQACWLRSHQRAESSLLERYFGLVTETRLEGIAITDPEDYLTDVVFPGISTVSRLALLALPELISLDGALQPNGRYLVTREQLQAVCADLIERFPAAWSKRAIDDLDRLTGEVLQLLASLGLAAQHSTGGWLIAPVAHRWIPSADDTPAKPVAVLPAEPGWSLFDEEGDV